MRRWLYLLPIVVFGLMAAGFYIGLIKDTSLAAIIGVFELTRAAQETIERTLRSFEIYMVAAAIYFLICFPLTQLARRAEARLQRPS